DFLKQQLPGYMVPSAFVLLAALPLTPNGKVDRNTLPAPDVHAAASADGPRTAIEELLAGIWATVLHQERVNVDADFFSLGGHSLLATRVVSRLRDTFQVDLPLRTLFEAPTLASLAERIAAARYANPAVLLPPIRPRLRMGAVPLSFAQQRLWFLDQLQPNNPAYNVFVAV